VLTPFDHAFTIVLVALFPVWGSTLGYRRLKRADPAERPRLRLLQYRRAIAVQWLLVAALAALWVARHRPWSALGLVPRLTPGLGGVAFGTVIVLFYMLRERGKILRDEEGLAEVRTRLDHVQPLMPRTPIEFRWFFALSITAGVCEEALYRGYLLWYFQHGLGLIPAAAASTVAFGIGHSYQGLRGVLTTGAAGAFLAAVYLVSGSLLMPMLLHALMDLHSGHLGYVAFSREDAARARAALEAEAERVRFEREATAEAGGLEREAGGLEREAGRLEREAGRLEAEPRDRDEGSDAASL